MGCQHLEELYELFMLGALSEEASAELRDHLERGCEYCQARVREAVATIYLLCLTAKPARPNPRLKSQILRDLQRR